MGQRHIHVFTEGQRVILDLGGRGYDVFLSPLSAATLADTLQTQARQAAKNDPLPPLNQSWGCQVTNIDRQVVLRVKPPPTHPGAPSRVPLSVEAARTLADLLTTNANMAGFGLQLRTKPTTPSTGGK